MTKTNAKKYSKWLMSGSIFAIVLSGIGYLGYDFWLASTQWLLVAVVLAMFGVYLKLS